MLAMKEIGGMRGAEVYYGFSKSEFAYGVFQVEATLPNKRR